MPSDRRSPQFTSGTAQWLWIATLIVGLIVLLASQMSIVENVCRRWTDIIWSGSRWMREGMASHRVSRIYYTILTVYVTWTVVCATLFLFYSKPRVMVLVIANLNNVALGFTAFFIHRNHLRFLPWELRPGWINRIGIVMCGVFYLGLAGLVFYHKQLPLIRELFGAT